MKRGLATAPFKIKYVASKDLPLGSRLSATVFEAVKQLGNDTPITNSEVKAKSMNDVVRLPPNGSKPVFRGGSRATWFAPSCVRRSFGSLPSPPLLMPNNSNHRLWK